MQSNDRNTNSIVILTQSFSFVTIGLEKKQIKEINHNEKFLFQLNETLNVNLNMNFVFDNHNFKNKAVNLTQAIQTVVNKLLLNFRR